MTNAISSAAEQRVKVFISYSRADKAFADDLVLGLAACGFAPYIDRRDIVAGEAWEQRLSGLIAEADTVVYVISPDSVSSEHCGWELTESFRLAKRVLPVMWREVDDAATPLELRRLNYIFFEGEDRTFVAGLAELAEALRTDIDWIREHTRLAALAQRWSAGRRAPERLLRGDDLDAAKAWMGAKPMNAPAITDEQADFIKASSDAKVEAERRAARARAGLLTAVSIVAVVFAGLAGMAAWQWRSAAAAEATAEQRRDEAVAANALLEDANLRLNADIGLRTAPSDTGYFVIDKGWYPVAANFSGAVARVDRSGGGRPSSIGSGFLIDGGLIHPGFAGEALLVAPERFDLPTGDAGADLPPEALLQPPPPADTLPADAHQQPQHMLTSDTPADGPIRLEVSFPTLGGEPLPATQMIWRRPEHLGGVYPIEIWKLDGALPRGVRAVGEADVDCQDFEQTPDGRTVGSFGIAIAPEGARRSGSVTLNISDLLDRTDPYSMRYTHATNIVSEGAPVFDFVTGQVFAIHIGSGPDADRPGRRAGYGISLRLVLDMARQQIEDAQLPPVCEN